MCAKDVAALAAAADRSEQDRGARTLVRAPRSSLNRVPEDRLSDDGGGREGFGWHRAVEMPGDCDRAIAGVADVLASAQEQVRGRAKLVDLVLTGEQEDAAVALSVIDVS